MHGRKSQWLGNVSRDHHHPQARCRVEPGAMTGAGVTGPAYRRRKAIHRQRFSRLAKEAAT